MTPLLREVRMTGLCFGLFLLENRFFVKRTLHSTMKSFLAVTFKFFPSRKISNKANIFIYFTFQKNRLHSESRSGLETNSFNIKVQVHVLWLYFPQRGRKINRCVIKWIKATSVGFLTSFLKEKWNIVVCRPAFIDFSSFFYVVVFYLASEGGYLYGYGFLGLWFPIRWYCSIIQGSELFQ